MILSFLVLLFIVPASSWGLTIYRIGGKDLPPPAEEGMEGVRVVRMSWEEFAQDAEGRIEGLDANGLGEGKILPIQVLPTENISRRAIARGGGGFVRLFTENRSDFVDAALDGNPATVLSPVDLAALRARSSMAVHLGGRFPINRIRFYPPPDKINYHVEDFTIKVNLLEGDRDRLVNIHRKRGNRKDTVEVHFPTLYTERIQMDIDNFGHYLDEKPWEVAEFEIYGFGYVPEAIFVSRVVDFGAPASIGKMYWTGFRHPEGVVQIQTRVGSDADPDRYWRVDPMRQDEKTFRDESGRPLTRRAWEGLPGGRAEITPDLDNWTVWSTLYSFADTTETRLVSPGARQYMQWRAEFLPTPTDGAGLDYLEFRVSQPPVASQVVGEIWPTQVPPGGVSSFVYAFKPIIGAAESGFDRLKITTPGEFVSIDSVHINGAKIESPERELGQRIIVVGLPRMGMADSRKTVEVFFKAKVFRYGSRFHGELFDSTRLLEVAQVVEEGDATFALESSQLTVGIDLGGSLLRGVAVEPAVVTPNGDGINDRVRIGYTLLELAGEGQVEVDIFDLSGRRVQRVYRGLASSGEYEQWWDGMGFDGALVVPGLYIYRIFVRTDEGEQERGGLIPVAW